MEKKAVGKQTGGFIQQRKGTRPYRVETLLGRGNDKRPSDLVETYEPQQPSPEQQFEGSIVGMVHDEFKKHSALEGMVEGPSPVVGAIGDTVARHAAQEKERGRQQSAQPNRRPEAEPHRPYVPTVKTGQVYHYGPRGVDLTREGLKTPATLDDASAWHKYRSRASDKPEEGVTRQEVLDWLEKERGPGGSRMVSVLHQPIRGDRPEQQEYASRRQLYKIDLDRARREGAIESSILVEESPRSKRRVSSDRLVRELSKAKGFTPKDLRLTFQGTPHGMLVVRGGTLPGKYISKEGQYREELQKTGKDSQYRERVEVYGLRNGKLMTGRRPDRSVWTFGGGIDPGETPEQAGAREYLEESGHRLRNVRRLQAPPHEEPWEYIPKPGDDAPPEWREQQAQRIKQFPKGVRTTFLTGEVVGRPRKHEDVAGKLNVSLRNSARELRYQERLLPRMQRPADISRQESRIAALRALRKEGARREFAPGIPAQRKIRSIPRVAERGPNREWTVSLSKHPAAKRGDHLDLRLIDPKGKAHSWAFNDMPEPGKGTYAAQQATHSGQYARRKKPFSIPLNVYGGTRPGAKVEPVYVQPTEVISSSSDRVHFLRHQGQQTDEFVLKRLSKPEPGSSQSPMWALRNATRNRSTKEGKLLPNFKPRYKDTDPDQIDLNDGQQVLTPKIDGAHTLIDFPKKDRMMRVYSYRPTQRKQGLIEHTFKFPGFHERKVPKGLQGTILRAEAWASDPSGKAVPASEVGGLLNSSVPKSRQAQEAGGLKMRLTGIDVVRHGGKDYSNKPYAEKLDVIRKVTKMMHGAVEAPIVARTPGQKKKLLSAVKAGKLPETKEGVVVHELNRDAPFQRAKIRPDHDVYVRRIDTKKSSPKGQASGFSYSFEPDGKVVGRVGTGLSRSLRQDMAANPEKYVGRVAKVRSAGRHQKRKDPSQGALTGSPAFKEWHIDKTPPELLKEGEFAEAIGEQLEGLAGRIDPENLISGYVGGRGKGLKLLKVKPVDAKVQKLRKAYRRIVGRGDDK